MPLLVLVLVLVLFQLAIQLNLALASATLLSKVPTSSDFRPGETKTQ